MFSYYSKVFGQLVPSVWVRPRARGGVTIEIINNTRAGIVIFFQSKKREHAIGGQIQVPDALTLGVVPKTCVVFFVFFFVNIR